MNYADLVVAVTAAAAVEGVGSAGVGQQGVSVDGAGVVEGQKGAHCAGVADDPQPDRHPPLQGHTPPRGHRHPLQPRTLALCHVEPEPGKVCRRQADRTGGAPAPCPVGRRSDAGRAAGGRSAAPGRQPLAQPAAAET